MAEGMHSRHRPFLAKGVGDEPRDRQLHQAEMTAANCTPWEPAIPEQSFQNLPDPRNIGIIALLHKIAFSSMFFYSSETTVRDHRQDAEAGPVKTHEVERRVPSPGRRLTEQRPADLLRRGHPPTGGARAQLRPASRRPCF